MNDEDEFSIAVIEGDLKIEFDHTDGEFVAYGNGAFITAKLCRDDAKALAKALMKYAKGKK